MKVFKELSRGMAAKIQVPPIGGQHRDRHVPTLGSRAAYVRQAMRDNRIEHRECIVRHEDDMPEVRDWTWPRAG